MHVVVDLRIAVIQFRNLTRELRHRGSKERAGALLVSHPQQIGNFRFSSDAIRGCMKIHYLLRKRLDQVERFLFRLRIKLWRLRTFRRSRNIRYELTLRYLRLANAESEEDD